MSYQGFIPQNIAPTGTRRIGIYDGSTIALISCIGYEETADAAVGNPGGTLPVFRHSGGVHSGEITVANKVFTFLRKAYAAGNARCNGGDNC